MVIEQNTVIGGEIVGIGKIRADGSEEFTWLKDPIHNQITTKGIDNLLMWNGGNALPSSNTDKEISSLYMPCQAVQSNYYQSGVIDAKDSNVIRTGVLYYSAYGDGRGSIDPDTATDLIHKISNYSTSFKKGRYFNGSNCVSVAGNHQLQFRVTHTYSAATEHQNVNEIGFYHKVEPSGDYTLFSRVQLDNTYELEVGESLLITYQLNVKYPSQPKHIDDFFGLKDINGNTLQANETTCIKVNNLSWTSYFLYNCNSYVAGSTSYSNYTWAPAIPIISNSYIDHPSGPSTTNPWGIPSFAVYKTNKIPYGSKEYGWRPVWGLKYETELRCIMIPNDVTNLEMMNVNGPTLENVKYQESVITTQILPYTPGAKYRDYVLILQPGYPNLNSGENYVDFNVLVFNGIAYRFGYYDNGTWVPQKLRKTGDQLYKLTYRMSYTAE